MILDKLDDMAYNDTVAIVEMGGSMKTKLTARVPTELLRQAKAVAALRGETITEVVERCLADYVARGKQELKELQTD